MHRSRLTAVGVDVPEDLHEATVAFWSGALGGDPRSGDDVYTGLGRHGLDVFVQRLDDGAARVHLDIETDDVDAEVTRLERLGARRVEQVQGWWILRDPSGLLFCVVPPQTEDFPAGATTWE